MLLDSSFNEIASEYDDHFTNSIIGKMQRGRVKKIVSKYLPKNKSLSILEINCGTGEDAIWLTHKGHHVLATDISDKMIDIAKTKAKNLQLNIQFDICSFSELKQKLHGQKFDLIFSNFAGLNCISEEEFKKLNTDFELLLKPNGKLIFILLGKYCWIERVYFALKKNVKNSKRRLSPNEANLGNNSFQKVWCYSVKEVQKMFYSFKLNKSYPIGIIIPPSYFEKTLIQFKSLIPLIKYSENCFAVFSFLTNYGDHACIILSHKES